MARLAVGAVLAGTVMFGAASIITGSDLAFFMCLAIGVTTVEVAALTIAARGFTAPLVSVLVINTIAIAGFALWLDVRHEAVVSAQLPVSQEQITQALLASLALTGAITVGALLARPAPIVANRLEAVRVPTRGMIALGYAVIAIAVLGRGSAILRSSEYLGANGPLWAASLAGALLPLGALAFCVALFQPGHRVAAGIGLLLVFMILLGAASRQAALIPGMLILGRMLAPTPSSGRRRLGLLSVGVALIGTVVLAQLVLELRLNPGGVGIVRLSERIAADPGIVTSQLNPAEVLGNTLFATPLTARVAAVPLPMDVLWTAVNPLPGSMTDWPVMAPSLRINIYTPFNAVGELAAMGWSALVGYGLFAGLILGVLSRIAGGLPTKWRLVGVIAVMGLTVLFSVTLLQYNLRTGTRLLWYAAAVLLALRVVTSRSAKQRGQAEAVVDSPARATGW